MQVCSSGSFVPKAQIGSDLAPVLTLPLRTGWRKGIAWCMGVRGKSGRRCCLGALGMTRSEREYGDESEMVAEATGREKAVFERSVGTDGSAGFCGT